MSKVARDKDVRCGRLLRFAFDFQPAIADLFYVGAAIFEELKLRRLPDGEEHRIAWHFLYCGVIEDGRESPLLVINPQAFAEPNGGNMPIIAADDLDRAPAVLALNSFFIALDYPDRIGRHFGTFEREQDDAAGLFEPCGGPCRIDRDLTDDRPGHIIGDISAMTTMFLPK